MQRPLASVSPLRHPATFASNWVAPARAHHSFAMYDEKRTYVLTGVVTRVSPDPSHLSIFFSPLDEARDAVVRDASGNPVTWSVELRGAAQVAKDGVTVQSFPPGTIFSIGLHPLRNGLPGGGRGRLRAVQVSAENASFARQALRQRRRRNVARPGRAARTHGSMVAVKRARALLDRA